MKIYKLNSTSETHNKRSYYAIQESLNSFHVIYEDGFYMHWTGFYLQSIKTVTLVTLEELKIWLIDRPLKRRHLIEDNIKELLNL